MKHKVYYCLPTDELWIISQTKNEVYKQILYGVTWNDICYFTKQQIEQNFYYIGEL